MAAPHVVWPTLALLLVGCTPAAPASPPTAHGPVEAVAVAPAFTLPEPVACQPGAAPTPDEVEALLVRASMHAPLDDLAGDARAEAEGWAALNLQGWPPRQHRSWPARAWTGVTVGPGQGETYVAALTLADAYSMTGEPQFSVTHLDLVCDGGRLKILREENGYGNRTPPADLPGQRGDLTEDLALALGREAMDTSQGPWFARATTGISWEVGRAVEIDYAGQGFARRPPQLRAGIGIRFLERSDTAAVGEWLFRGGPGALVRFERVDGLWKVANQMEGSQWLTPREHPWRSPDLLDFRPFGLEMRMREETVAALLGQPDETARTMTGRLWQYRRRGVEVYLDQIGRAERVRIRSGSLDSGVAVGAPASLLEAMFGPSPNYTYPGGLYETLQFTVEQGRVTAITVFRQ